MQRVFDHAALPQLLPYRVAGCCLPLHITASAARDCRFRGSIPRLRLPLSTLRRTPYGLRRMTRGQNDWLGLFCATLSFATSCSFPGASMRSTNPIWRLAPVFDQLGSWNEKTMLVIVGNGAAGRKCEGWSMNSKRAD
jgi:hypothetical protein